jgi:1,2-diacylglycerol-3-alpha-glucose alpha-1,2-galactosyltransferase
MSQQFSLYILLYGYLAIFSLIFLQEIGIPIPLPNELLMLFSGYLVFKNFLNAYFLLLDIVLADFLGTMTLYLVFYFFGGYLMKHKPGWFPLSQEKLDHIKDRVLTEGWSTIYLCRVTPLIRGYTSLAAGLLRLPPGKYWRVALISSTLVCTAWLLAGYIAGPYYTTIAGHTQQVKGYLLLLILVAAIIFISSKVLGYFQERARLQQKAQYLKDHLIRLHIISETAWITQGQGVHTAYVELNELLSETAGIDIRTNEQGSGNIFHSHTYGPYYFWKGLRYKGRRILTAHVIPDSSRGTIPYWRFLMPLTTRYLRMAYSYADVVVAISPTVEDAIKRLGIDSKIVKIYNPVLLNNWKRNADSRVTGRQILGITDAEKMVLGVGQLQERKGVEDFIDMAAAMPDTRFVWVGGRPWGAFTEGVARINKRIENAPPNLQFTGLLDLKDMPPMYAAADVFLFPSYQENCPLAPLEAAASGLPVVFRDIPEYTRLFTVPYLKAVTTDEFVLQTRQLLSNKDHYREAVIYSEQLIRLFDKDQIKKQVIQLYRGLLKQYLEIDETVPAENFKQVHHNLHKV